MIVVTQRIYPAELVDVFGIFDTKELAESEVKRVVNAIRKAYPSSNTTIDTFGGITVQYDEKNCIQFHYSQVEANKQLRRTHISKYDVLAKNGWEANGERVFLWRP